jgi:hypothetical protein
MTSDKYNHKSTIQPRRWRTISLAVDACPNIPRVIASAVYGRLALTELYECLRTGHLFKMRLHVA